MTLRELIQLLRKAADVKEIDKYRDEIVELIHETKIILQEWACSGYYLRELAVIAQ